jgi:hypothetical protein
LTQTSNCADNAEKSEPMPEESVMVLQTNTDDLESPKKLHPHIYQFGGLIRERSPHLLVDRLCRSSDPSHDPELAEQSSAITENKFHCWNSMMQSIEYLEVLRDLDYLAKTMRAEKINQ